MSGIVTDIQTYITPFSPSYQNQAEGQKEQSVAMPIAMQQQQQQRVLQQQRQQSQWQQE
jgi:hypothetical protein